MARGKLVLVAIVAGVLGSLAGAATRPALERWLLGPGRDQAELERATELSLEADRKLERLEGLADRLEGLVGVVELELALRPEPAAPAPACPDPCPDVVTLCAKRGEYGCLYSGRPPGD